MGSLREFPGPNAAYVLELYERYRQNPESVDPVTRAFFAVWGPPIEEEVPPPERAPVSVQPVIATVELAKAIRQYGHLAARLDPLGSPPPGDPALDLRTYGLTPAMLLTLPAEIVGGPAAAGAANAWEALERLRAIYCGTTGYEFDHLTAAEERAWLTEAVESQRFWPPHDPVDEILLLDHLTRVEVFEQFLHRSFPGQKRFSLEGTDMLVPVLEEIICRAAAQGTRQVFIGMAHRGRLNVLAHVLGKPYSQILAEFAGHTATPEEVAPTEGRDHGWTGDVKYHLGARATYLGECLVGATVTLAPNPSHLCAIDPVVVGMARAAMARRAQPGAPSLDPQQALTIVVHGDAAFPGQGVVAETFNLSRVPGYWTGGTVHIIVNNQLGFTTEPEEGRSTLYASDLAKGFEVPIVHVNADDPIACLAAARLAVAYRQRFQKDFLIDLIGYRRWGHNEADDPTFTQPRLYAVIEKHPTVRQLWAERLIAEGKVRPEQVEAMVRAVWSELEQVRAALPPEPAHPEPVAPPPRPALPPVETAVPAERLRALNDHLCAVPPGFTVHPRLQRILERRRAALDGAPAIEWAQAEMLAFATLLADGVPVRLTGQDTARGTFSQRHLVWHDVETGATYTALQTLPQARASFEVYNTPLTENAVLGFEYGYSVGAPEALVLWEAQFGDFVNGAQVVVDQFLAAAQAKWGQRSGLVLLLPHGYEGQGPEHSSARPERFLQLAAEDNLRIANCTTAAQYFHLLRRQGLLLAHDRRPLVIFTPKSLLRHPFAMARLTDLTAGTFQPVLDDPTVAARDRVTRLILCTGKVAVDLLTSDRRAAADWVAVVRVEELYPFPATALRAVLAAYPNVREVVWLQEEPQNMGAWAYMLQRLPALLPAGVPLRYLGRPERASPAEGTLELHMVEQERIIAAAFSPAAHPEPAEEVPRAR